LVWIGFAESGESSSPGELGVALSIFMAGVMIASMIEEEKRKKLVELYETNRESYLDDSDDDQYERK